MVRENHRGRQRGARGGGARPPVASTLEGSNTQGEDKVIGEEHIFVGDVVGLMTSFQRMS
jgi:hypothetical protein